MNPWELQVTINSIDRQTLLLEKGTELIHDLFAQMDIEGVKPLGVYDEGAGTGLTDLLNGLEIVNFRFVFIEQIDEELFIGNHDIWPVVAVDYESERQNETYPVNYQFPSIVVSQERPESGNKGSYQEIGGKP